MKNIISFVLLLLATVIADSNITIQDIQDHITYLASDKLEGRKPGTAFADSAALYIKKQITLSNTHFLAEDGFQNFEIITDLQLGSTNFFRFGSHTLHMENDYIPMPFSISDSATAKAVWLGYGLQIDTKELQWNDYAGVNVNGKWAMMLFGDPEIDDPQSDFAQYSADRNKVLKAKDMGAVGIIFVAGPEYDGQDKLVSLKIRDSHLTAGLPVLQLKRSVVDSLFLNGTTVEELENSYNENRVSNSFALKSEIQVSVEINRMKSTTSNVVAVIPGTDDVLKDEYIVIGAHYDHLGWGGPGTSSRAPDTTAIHNGADDNASGVAGIIELFEKFSSQPAKRSILLVAFGAEEMGLLGSTYFIDNPLVDLEQIKFMMNFDMIGRLDSLQSLTANGTGTAISLAERVEQHAESHQLNVHLSPQGLGPSDHAPFYASDIPVLMLFTNVHPDYHTPRDDVEFINFSGQKQVLEFAFDLINDIANETKALVYQQAGPKERPSTRRRFKVTLGIMPDHAANVKGLRIAAVMPERPAFFAGMAKGDVIIAMDGKKVENIYDYMYRLGEFETGQRISVKVKRGEEIKILIVDL